MSTLEPPVNSARSAEPPVEPPRLTAPSSSGKSALSRRLRRWERGTLELNNLWYECVTVYRRTKNACKGDLSDLFSTAGRLRRVRRVGQSFRAVPGGVVPTAVFVSLLSLLSVL